MRWIGARTDKIKILSSFLFSSFFHYYSDHCETKRLFMKMMNTFTLFVLVSIVVTTNSFTVTHHNCHNARIGSLPKQRSLSQLHGFESEAVASFMAEVTAVQEALVAAGVAAFAGFAVTSSKKKESEGETKPKVVTESVKVDVSIPYDAAALLQYNAWKGSLPYNEVSFKAFKTIYEEKAVAEVSAKQTTRQLELAMAKADEQLAALLTKIS